MTLESRIKDIREGVDRNAAAQHDRIQESVQSTDEVSSQPTGLQEITSNNLYDEIQPAYRILLETLRLYESERTSRGNFTAKLVEALFPELFGPAHLHKNYSYNG